MTVELEQEDAIASIEKLEILPVKAQVVIKDVENYKLVTRKYQINCIDYPVTSLVIQYSLSSYKEQVKDYFVKLTDESGLEITLCKYSAKIFNTLFNNIILLELNNWRRISQGEEPLTTIYDYDSLMFELSSNVKLNTLLKKLWDKNALEIIQGLESFVNSNNIVPVEIWEKQIN